MSDKQYIPSREQLVELIRDRLGDKPAAELEQVFAEEGSLAGLLWIRNQGIDPRSLEN